MGKTITLKKKSLGKGFYYYKNGDYMRQTLKKYDESKLSGYRYKKNKDGKMILLGVVKDKYVKKGEPKMVALSLLINKNVDANTLKGDVKKMMLKFKKKDK